MMKLNHASLKRLRLTIRGVVQGVGFRPFIYRLAREAGLTGWVNNSPAGVTIEVEGTAESLKDFQGRVPREKPAHSYIQSLLSVELDPAGFTSFDIRDSDTSETRTAFVLPDMATCPECLKEIFDTSDRRYLYPFTNCTHCGPRYTIIEALPYDRQNTSMKIFEMCPACHAEYIDPADRRFHAQPNACPECGPRLEFRDADGKSLFQKQEALEAATADLKRGKVIAVKGLGGFHLMVDAGNEEAVRRLRERKHREGKPLAVMFPSLETIESACRVSALEGELLLSSEAPIVLLEKNSGAAGHLRLAESVAPANPYLGAMLPYTPLHHILMRTLNKPLVATSGNLSDEPICVDEREAVERLSGIADGFLIHNRPIVRAVDDSVARLMRGRTLVLRRARGYAPLPVLIPKEGPGILALGAHLKNAVAVSVRDNVFISQHIGDLETAASYEAFQRTIDSLKSLYEPDLAATACDAHPEYLSTPFASQTNLHVVSVQHHHAHVVSCMAENHLEGRVLGMAWDGTGYGTDGTIWGGEFLYAGHTDFKRAGHLRTLRLPGGEKAVREPRRTALGLLAALTDNDWSAYEDLPPFKTFSSTELAVLARMLKKEFQAPATSSVGRLFDAVASLIGVVQESRFEGEAAMALEFLIGGDPVAEHYPFDIRLEVRPPESGARTDAAQASGTGAVGKGFSRNSGLPAPGGTDTILIADWGPMMAPLIHDVRRGTAAGVISVKFHNTLVEMAAGMARRINEKRVVLSGGCFQNKYLTERLIGRLSEEGFQPYWHQLVPPNDGGIALGQAVVAINRSQENVFVRSGKD